MGNINQQFEFTLIKNYEEECWNFGQKVLNVAKEDDKYSFKRCLNEFQQKIEIFEKQILKYKQLFPNDSEVIPYEAGTYHFKAILKIYFSLFHSKYSFFRLRTKIATMKQLSLWINHCKFMNHLRQGF